MQIISEYFILALTEFEFWGARGQKNPCCHIMELLNAYQNKHPIPVLYSRIQGASNYDTSHIVHYTLNCDKHSCKCAMYENIYLAN